MFVVRKNQLFRIARACGLAALVWTVAAGLGCGGAIQSVNKPLNDPLALGVEPGPLGSTNPQTIQVRLGSEPNNRIVSLSLTIDSLEAKNSGDEYLDLLTQPVTVESARTAITSDPVVVRTIYQDTYSELRVPAMTGHVDFYDINGQLVSQSFNVTAQSVTLTDPLVLGPTSPLVFSVSLDLSQSFTLTDNPPVDETPGSTTFSVNTLVVNATAATPNPAPGQPETGSFSFLAGLVTAVDTNAQVISLTPVAGNPMQLSYGLGTVFHDCNASVLSGMMIEVKGDTQTDGSLLASDVVLIDNATSTSEVHGILSGQAPDGLSYNLVFQGGMGVNVTDSLQGQTVTMDSTAASFNINHGAFSQGLNLFVEGADGQLVFDADHLYPGQLVATKRDTLFLSDPDSCNAGCMQPLLVELEEQTLTGKVLNYTYDGETQYGSFQLVVDSNSPIKLMNPGLTTITVDQVPLTYLRNSPTFNNDDVVKVRGLLLVDPNYFTFHPGDPIAFVMVADRISQ